MSAWTTPQPDEPRPRVGSHRPDPVVAVEPPLPNFLVVGAMKAGTTSLAAWLREHPSIFIPQRKELKFFHDPTYWKRGVEWYRQQFAGAAGEPAVGEATPGYMAHPEARERIARVLPGVRLIAILRHPAERAYSQYHHLKAVGRERRTFAKVIEEELGGSPPAFAYYYERGRYLDHLKALRALFPPEDIHIVLFEDLVADPNGTFATVCAFLGVDAEDAPDNVGRVYNPRMRVRSVWLRNAIPKLRARRLISASMAGRIKTWNSGASKKPYPPFDPELRQRLVDAYADQLPELEAMIGRDLSAWRR